MNNRIQNSLFETMKIFADQAKETSTSAKIIECTVLEVLDAGLAKYSVEYFGNIFSVFSNNQNITYSVGENVYVLVPDGNLNKNKVIIGSVNPSITTFIDDEEIENKFYEISDNLIDNQIGTIKMSSYQEVSVKDIPITQYTPYSFSKVLNNYLKDSKTFAFGCLVKTDLAIEQQNSGNYGISLNLPLITNAGEGKRELIWKSYYLDTTNMLGNFYRYNVWTPQTVYFTIDEQYSLSEDDLPTLSYYCSDFSQNPAKAEIKDIYIKDFYLKVVDELNLEDSSGLLLKLKASEGVYFSENYKSKKVIVPTLKINNKITELSDCNIYWFRENTSIKSSSPAYCVYGGNGWECLNKKTNVILNDDGTESFEWVTSVTELEVKKEEVSSSIRYKCVIKYNEQIVSSIITLKNLDNRRTFDLTTPYGYVSIKDTGYAYLKTITSIDGITDKEEFRNNIVYSWSRYDKNNNYIKDGDKEIEVVEYNKINESKYETLVKFPVNLIEDFNYFYCTAILVKENLSEEIIGTESVKILTTITADYTLNINNDDIIYKYDTNGNSPAGEAYDGPSTSKIESINPLSFVIRKPDGTELTKEEYSYVKYRWTIPKNSLYVVTNYTDNDEKNYYFEGYGQFNLFYKINNRYNISKAKQNAFLTITFKETTLSRNSNILFMKEGESGSNGTSYAARLVAGGLTPETSYPYGKINSEGISQKLKFVFNINNNKLYYYDYNEKTLKDWSVNKRKVFPQVYENSELLTYNTNYEVQYSMFDKKFTNPCFTVGNIDSTNGGVVLELESNPTSIYGKYCNILQAKIKVKKGNNSIIKAPEIIYAYYPIELTLVDFETLTVPSLEGGFAEVMYAADGTNPAWDETSSFEVIDVNNFINNLGLSKFYDFSWDKSEHLVLREMEDGKVKGEPNNKYDDGDSKNYVSVTMQLKNNAASLISSEIAGLQQEIQELGLLNQAAVNNKKYLTDFGSLYNIESWLSTLDEIKDLLDNKTRAVNKLNLILSAIDNFVSYVDMSEKNLTAFCKSTINQVSALESQTREVLTSIKQLDGISHNFEDLISLQNNKINWDATIKENYISSIGLETTLNLEILVQDINIQVEEYQKAYLSLMQLSSFSYLEEYSQIIKEIETMNSKIKEDSYQKYLLLKEKVSNSLKLFYSYTSRKDLKEVLNNMYNLVLTTTFILKDNNLILNQSTEEELNNISQKAQKTIQEKEKLILRYNAMLSTRGHEITHIRPIVFYYNRYGLSNLNAWDGNKIETGENDEYLLAPQVGAGIKENDNSFTGIVIGQRNIGSQSELTAQTGLFGYNKGKQSIFLNAETGASIFGVAGSGGQIIIDPNETKGLLYSSNFWKNYNSKTGLPASYSTSNYNKKGLMIDLTTPEIRFGNGAFVVDSSGHATIAGGGSIAGWDIDDTTIASKVDVSDGRLVLDSGAYVSGYDSKGNKIYEADEPGKIYSGEHDTLTSTSKGFYLSEDGLSIGSQVKISNRGVLSLGSGAVSGSSSKHWTISANSGESYIGYGTSAFSASNLDNVSSFSIGGGDNQVYIGTDGIRIGSNFAVDNDGNTVIKHLIVAQSSSNPGLVLNSENNYLAYGKSQLIDSNNGFYLGPTGISITTSTSSFVFSTEENRVRIGHASIWNDSIVHGFLGFTTNVINPQGQYDCVWINGSAGEVNTIGFYKGHDTEGGYANLKAGKITCTGLESSAAIKVNGSTLATQAWVEDKLSDYVESGSYSFSASGSASVDGKSGSCSVHGTIHL